MGGAGKKKVGEEKKRTKQRGKKRGESHFPKEKVEKLSQKRKVQAGDGQNMGDSSTLIKAFLV